MKRKKVKTQKIKDSKYIAILLKMPKIVNMEVDFLKKIAKKLICRNIIKILKSYQKILENDKLIFKDYLDQTIYFEIDYLIKLLKEKRSDFDE